MAKNGVPITHNPFIRRVNDMFPVENKLFFQVTLVISEHFLKLILKNA